jgi:hypothetical protein
VNKQSASKNKIIILSALVGIIALLHYATPTEPHHTIKSTLFSENSTSFLLL